MKRILCEKLPEPHRPSPLPEKEATHAIKVFRLKDGDLLEAIDGKGHGAVVRLRTRSGEPRLEFVEKDEQHSLQAVTGASAPFILEMAILKGEAMEWVVEKAVELGASTLIPLVTAHTVVQVDKKGPEAFRERWQKIADQALKQCGRLDRLEIKTPVELETLLANPIPSDSRRLWCDESERTNAPELLNWLESTRDQSRSELRILIGPEGGFSSLERDLLSRDSKNIARVSLGPLILRAETAALFTLSLIASDFRERFSTQFPKTKFLDKNSP
jgi:16S rRNA (uracil1498-N3)-methyltransferase